ncbi:class I SAM-dependent methyltransferase [Sphingomonas solaris]|uniref:Class I SAM-dependent methyltransferase n=1 Tax=Alterirhizorhabdus solaris TaxID=2529389 RepID=A0A558R5U6_9SPHN|nr:methyltransferase domain-containing protein [Sphingomonas solaris]TVV74756.1 class I SAM-dependent methyltransferase [Sphingomonas solaris]
MSDPMPELPAGAFAKQDTGDDLAFYAPPRLVTHIDEAAVVALTRCYRDLVPADARVLDLMSSWVSHLPDDGSYSVIGHGMNADELAANPRLDRWFVRDLNADPALPLDTDAFEAALCCVGVQYLQRPYDVFAEVRRVLTPGAPFIVSYSNRCFPTKAVAVWRSLEMNEQAALIGHYLSHAGFGQVEAQVLADGSRGDPLIAVVGRA